MNGTEGIGPRSPAGTPGAGGGHPVDGRAGREPGRRAFSEVLRGTAPERPADPVVDAIQDVARRGLPRDELLSAAVSAVLDTRFGNAVTPAMRAAVESGLAEDPQVAQLLTRLVERAR